MEVYTEKINFDTQGYTDIIDITDVIQSIVQSNGFTEGQALVCCVGSTGAITTVEFEPGLVDTDLPDFFEKIAPYEFPYAHHNTWGDDNGASHVRASLLGSSETFPFYNGSLLLGTWQQIIFIDFDTRPRSRTVVVQLTGKKKD